MGRREKLEPEWEIEGIWARLEARADWWVLLQEEEEN